MEEKIKAVFFDRDGVVNLRIIRDYIKTPAEFHFMPDFLKFFPKIRKKGYKTFVATNQQGVGKGVMTESQLIEVFEFMQSELRKKFHYAFDDIFFCTELAENGSFYRKPNPGMLLEAIEKWNIDPAQSWMIGDSPSDVIAGKKAGLKTILIGNQSKEDCPEADYIVMDFFEIMGII
jgi:D-glycero-D-manno-heptose 1,7-bisphosphate phosphatase